MTSRILLVCYSRSGTTLRVATHLAEALGADLERISENDLRSGVGGFVRSALEALAKGLPTIEARKDPRNYDVVVIGTPVWTGTMASPIRTYLFHHAQQLHNPAFFAVMGSRGGEETVRELKLACDAPHAPTGVFTQAEVEQGRFTTRCEEFVRAVHAELLVQPGHQVTAA